MPTMYPAKELSPTTTLSAAITSTDTSIPVTDVSVFPAAPNLATIGTTSTAEIVLYTGIDSVNKLLTGVTRGFNGTTAQAWPSGTQIGRMFTGYDHDTFKAEIENRIAIPSGSAHGDILYRGASGWTRLPAGTAGQYLQTQGAGANPVWAAASGGGGMTLISEVALTSSQSSVTFSSIPQSYSHLWLVSPYVWLSSNTTDITIVLGSASYDHSVFRYSSGVTGWTSGGYSYGVLTYSAQEVSFSCLIPSYSVNNLRKVAITNWGGQDAVNGPYYTGSSYVRSTYTSPVTSITIGARLGATLSTGTRLMLYGI